MDFSYPPEAEAFRREFRAWLDANLEDRFRDAKGYVIEPGERLETQREWNQKLADAGYAAIAWPKEYGGRDADVMEQVVWREEMHRAQAPGTINVIGLSNIAPAIMEHGSEEQKSHFLPRMQRGDDLWCQGFSEPDAGSDLASLRTSAVRDGADYIVNGQKVWTTLGAVSNYCELLVRTDPDAQKHQGITCLLLDMTLPGVEVRPIVTITGESEFSEIFLSDVRVSDSARLGPENMGWMVAMATLNSERGGVAGLQLEVRKRIRKLLDDSRDASAAGGSAAQDPVLRQKMARLYLDGEYLKLLSDRAISAMVHDRPGAEASLVKLVWAEVSQQICDVQSEVLGPAGILGASGRERLSSRALSIAGGTTQVNRNIVARRVLGLPKGR
jgi:alkylation response protein AidB-like acyl-CoA dehydrogenase